MAELRCSDGTVVPISEETEAELRKAFEPRHVWKPGDVLECYTGDILVCVENNRGEIRVFGAGQPLVGEYDIDVNLDETAVFLFNIKDKL